VIPYVERLLTYVAVIEVFKDTLAPASLVGLFTKLTGLLLSGYVGGLVDRVRRLRLVRLAIGAEKVGSPGDAYVKGLIWAEFQVGQLRALSRYDTCTPIAL
jgi:hypothetical protein